MSCTKDPKMKHSPLVPMLQVLLLLQLLLISLQHDAVECQSVPGPQLPPIPGIPSPIPGQQPVQPVPGVQPVQPFPGVQPVQPFPGVQPVQPFPGVQPGSQPFPGVQPVQPFPGVQPGPQPFPGQQGPFSGQQGPFPGQQGPFQPVPGIPSPFPGQQPVQPFPGVQPVQGPFPGQQEPFPGFPGQPQFPPTIPGPAAPPTPTQLSCPPGFSLQGQICRPILYSPINGECPYTGTYYNPANRLCGPAFCPASNYIIIVVGNTVMCVFGRNPNCPPLHFYYNGFCYPPGSKFSRTGQPLSPGSPAGVPQLPQPLPGFPPQPGQGQGGSGIQRKK